MPLDFSLSENTVGYIIDGVMDTAAINNLKNQILEKFKGHDRINLYLEDSGIDRFSLSAVISAALFPVEHHHRFNKIVLVTDRKWVHMLGAFDNLLVNVNLKSFTTENRFDAISWIAQA